MLKNNRKLDFCSRKFLSVLPATTLGCAVAYVVMLVGFLVAGSKHGENGISAVNLVLPLFTLTCFVALLSSKGTVIRFSSAKGVFDKKRADRVFSQGLILAVSFGIILFLLSFFCEKVFFDMMNPSLEVRQLAEEYFKPYPYLLLTFPTFSVLMDTVNADGDEVVTMIANAVFAIFAIVGAVVFFNLFGMKGIPLSTVLGIVLATLVLIAHFFKKKNSLRVTWVFSIKDAFSTMKYGLTDGAKYLCSTFLITFLNMFVIAKFGSEYLAMTALATSTVELAFLFDGIGEAFNPIISIYLGEKDNLGVKSLMKLTFLVAVIEGIVMTALILIFARPIATTFGITGVADMTPYVLTIRITASAFVATSLKFALTSYYLLRNKFFLSVSMTVVSDLIAPLGIGVLLAITFNGIEGIWVGMALSPIVSLVYGFVVVATTRGRKSFPLILDPKNDEKVKKFMIDLTPENAIEMSSEIAKYMRSRKVCESTVFSVELLLEELSIYLFKVNPKAKKLKMDCSVMVREEVVMILRYDGAVFDITKVEFSDGSVNEKFLSACVKRQKEINNVTTQGYNRNEFKYNV